MKIRNFLLIIVPVSLIFTGFYIKNQDSVKSSLLPSILQNLEMYHYNPPKIDDDFSKKVFDEFITVLDANKRFFTQEDIEKISIYKTKIDDFAKNGDYEFYDKTMEIYENRINQNQKWYREILSNPMDFNSNEIFNYDDKQPFAKNETELKDRLTKFLKYNVMTKLALSLETQENAKQNKDTSVKILLYDTLELQARKSVLKTQEDFVARWKKTKENEKKSYYINAVTSVFDPHTNYFPPADKENFDISISGRLEGIGASLQEKDGYIKVVRIVPGSPSALQGELKEGDIILKVAQGNKEPVDVVNMPMDDAIKMIRGPKGTEVRLTVKKPDGSTKVIKIIRDVVILDETFAKSVIIEDNDHKKVGYIFLPSFYTDINGGGGRTSWTDVRNEIRKLKNNGASSIIFDLRNNGGGSLQDVVYMSGLFVENGPIVQVKTRGEDPEVLEDYDPSLEWDGPLVVMVNEFSASASEILAAAMQDYKRAIIVGSRQTFGKGTVQRFIDLSDKIRTKEASDYGSVKITIQKFYRINGGATQLKGVESDIEFPDNFTYLKTGESEQDFPMIWDKISPAKYITYSKYYHNLSKVKSKSAARTKENETFKLIEENAKRIKKEDDKKFTILNLKSYMAEEKLKKEQSKKLESSFKEIQGFSISTLSEDKQEMEKDKGKMDRANDWYKSLRKDVYLYETLQIAEEL
ncbi:MAG: carboxy terminal-processing peptidase [Bacteroidetes bacterium]|nr:carboxy terminal-processing peptidase [Bacteroidota bacterium]